MAAERARLPFLVLRDGDGAQQIVTLPAQGSASIGRDVANEVSLSWDPSVSRVHAVLEFLGGEWIVADDGFSRNGTYVNGERLQRRRRLRDDDRLLIGATTITFRSPGARERSTTRASPEAAPPRLTDAQRRVLGALCRPVLETPGLATPATNRQIADELFLSVDAVKTHVRLLANKLEVGDLPQNAKRLKLAERAIDLGLVDR